MQSIITQGDGRLPASKGTGDERQQLSRPILALDTFDQIAARVKAICRGIWKYLCSDWPYAGDAVMRRTLF
jgi:hypothetical protein